MKADDIELTPASLPVGEWNVIITDQYGNQIINTFTTPRLNFGETYTVFFGADCEVIIRKIKPAT